MNPSTSYRNPWIDRVTVILCLCVFALFFAAYPVAHALLMCLAVGIVVALAIMVLQELAPEAADPVARWARRLVGHKHDTRYHWGELSFHWPAFSIGLKVTGGYSTDNDLLFVHFIVGTLVLNLPTKRLDSGLSDNARQFGFCTVHRSVLWSWGCKRWTWDLPFVSMNWERTDTLSHDMQLLSRVTADNRPNWRVTEALIEANCLRAPYTYRLRNGEVQNVIARVHVERRTWGRKWAGWWKHVRTSIEVQFSEGVGEGVDSWKGGCTGCGYDLRRGETALECLRRMEREREFR